MMSLIYGLAHALPILIAGQMFPTKRAVWMAAGAMLVFAVAVGRLAYVWLDLIGVALGLVIALRTLAREAAEDKDE